MEEKEEVIDETFDESQEEVTMAEEATDEPSSDDGSPVYLEDYQKLKKENETLKAQKEHWRKKAGRINELKPASELKQTNPEYLTREEAVLLAKGYDDEDLVRLNALAKAEGKKLSEVADDEMFIAWKEKKDEKVKAQKAQLGSSKSSSSKMTKPLSEMTRDEHMAYWKSLQK